MGRSEPGARREGAGRRVGAETIHHSLSASQPIPSHPLAPQACVVSGVTQEGLEDTGLCGACMRAHARTHVCVCVCVCYEDTFILCYYEVKRKALGKQFNSSC